MRKDLVTLAPLQSSFFSCEKDIELVLRTLFIDSKPYSDILKRLILVNKPDCLDLENKEYQSYIDSFSIGKLQDEGYIRLNPKIARKEFEDIKSFILISFDNFAPSSNPQFLDYTINFDVICYTDEWVMDNYQVRPIKICGYIDGILKTLNAKNQSYKKNNNGIKLTGIGEYQFLGCNEAVLNEDISMYTLSYRGVHFSEDKEDLTHAVDTSTT